MILITGATGFIGNATTRALQAKGKSVRCLVRNLESAKFDSEVEVLQGDLMEPDSLPKTLFKGIETIIHAAAQPHVMPGQNQGALTQYKQMNTDATVRLAELAQEQGVKRFIFISSIKVNGEKTVKGYPFTEKVNQEPEDPYGRSKYHAELRLLELANKSAMEVVVIRPPLVYGPGVKGNFNSLINLVQKGLPLPLKNITNKRSFVALDNLVSFICLCSELKASAAAKNNVFLISDDNDLSTTKLLQMLANATNSRLLLFSIPRQLMYFAARMLGKQSMIERLFGNLQVDITKAKDVLGWSPVTDMQSQLQTMSDTKMD